MINYFIAVAIKQTMPSTSSLSQYACTLLGLMNTASGLPGSKLKEEECPPLYAEGLCVHVFGEAYLAKDFEWLLRRDPEFGSDRFGQILRLYPESCFVIKRELEELMKDNGWRARPEFAAYIKALDKIPDLGEKRYANRSFFIDAPACFFREY